MCRITADVAGDNSRITTNSRDQSTRSRWIRIMMRQAAGLVIRHQSYIQRGGNVPACLEEVFIDNYLVLTAAAVLRHLEDDVGRAVEPWSPRPPRPNSETFEFRHWRQRLHELIS